MLPRDLFLCAMCQEERENIYSYIIIYLFQHIPRSNHHVVALNMENLFQVEHMVIFHLYLMNFNIFAWIFRECSLSKIITHYLVLIKIDYLVILKKLLILKTRDVFTYIQGRKVTQLFCICVGRNDTKVANSTSTLYMTPSIGMR